MKLSRVQIKKFRSIENCDIRIGSVSALVGENNVGKSALLRALNAFFNIEDEESYFFDSSHQYSQQGRPRIILTFSDLPDDEEILEISTNDKIIIELKYLPASKSFKLFYKSNTDKLKDLDLDFIHTIKKYVDYIFIPPTRSNEELKWQESKAIKRVISALLKDKFKSRDTVTSKFTAATDYLQRNALNKISKQLTEYYGDRSTFDFKLNFNTDLTFIDFLNDIDFQINENGNLHNIMDCGTGVQSLSIIALYRMLASLKKSNIIIGIEEPETNLHPQSQKQMVKRILSPNEQSVESQVLFTTHSTVVIDSLDHSNIVLFRKEPDSIRGFKTITTQVHDDFWIRHNISELQYYKFHNYRNSDFFFSRLVIIVESSIDAEVVKQLLLQRNIDIDDYPVSVLNIDGIDNIKYPTYLIKDLGIPYLLIVDKDFFTPYLNDSLGESRYLNGFPKYANSFTNLSFIKYLIPIETERDTLLTLLKRNHSKALDLLEKHSIICMKYSLDVDLVASDTASNLFYEQLNIPNEDRTKYELLVNRYKQIKKLPHLTKVIENTPHRNLPNSYKRIKKVVERLVKLTVSS